MPHFILSCASGARRQIPIAATPSRVGRAPGCDIRIDEPGVAPSLGLILRSLGDVFAVADLDEAPFIINGAPMARRLLRPGDQISLGSCRLTFHSDKPDCGPLPADLLERFLPEPQPAPPEPQLAGSGLGPHAGDRGQGGDGGDGADAWRPGAWARLQGVAGAHKGQTQWLLRDVGLLACSGSSAVITRRAGLAFITPADGMAPMIARRRASLGPNPLEEGAIIGLGASVFRFELAPAGEGPGEAA